MSPEMSPESAVTAAEVVPGGGGGASISISNVSTRIFKVVRSLISIVAGQGVADGIPRDSTCQLISSPTIVAWQGVADGIPPDIYLPTDIFSSILARLPVTCLQRLKSVNKKWLQVISDPCFAELHLTHQPLEFELIYSMLALPVNLNQSTFFLKILHYTKIPAKAKVYSSCKGLILFERESTFYVANLITGDTLRLPPSDGYIGFYRIASIGFDPCRREYKVVVLSTDILKGLPMLTCCVLTLQQGSGAWRVMDVPFPVDITQFNFSLTHFVHQLHQFYGSQLLARGGLHWIHSNGIISMDLGQEKFTQRTDLPFSSSSICKYGPIFLEWDGCLAVIPKYQWEPSYVVFILRESGWTELVVDITFFKHLCPFENFGETPPYPVASLRDGEVIIFKELDDSKRLYRTSTTHLADNKRFFAYHLQQQVMAPFTAVAPAGTSIYEFNGYYLPGTIMAHVNSMVPC